MRSPLVALALVFLALLLFASPRPARADVQNDIFQVLCMPELDVLEVRELHYLGQTVRDAIKQRNENLAKTYGIYAPKWNVRAVVGPDGTLDDIRSARFECSLSSGLSELDLTPLWLPQSSGRYSVSLTLRVAGGS